MPGCEAQHSTRDDHARSLRRAASAGCHHRRDHHRRHPEFDLQQFLYWEVAKKIFASRSIRISSIRASGMTQTQSRLERMDIAARAMVAEHDFAVERPSWTAIAGLVVFWAVRSTAPAPGTLGLRINAAVCAIIALLFWLNWRYALRVP